MAGRARSRVAEGGRVRLREQAGDENACKYQGFKFQDRGWPLTCWQGSGSNLEEGVFDKMVDRMKHVLARLHRDDSGQDLIEYALLAALIALAATVGMGVVASDINNAFATIGSRLSAAVGS